MQIKHNNPKPTIPVVSFRDLMPGKVYCRHDLSSVNVFVGLWMMTSNSTLVSLSHGTIKRPDDFTFRLWREVAGSFVVDE